MDRPQFKTIRRAYGFDEIAIVPGDVTVNPDQTSTELHIGEVTLRIPIFAAALDALVSPKTAALMSELGGLAVMNLEGLQTRYDKPDEVLEEIAKVAPKEATTTLQRLYSAPIQDRYVADRVREIKRAGALCAVSMTPATTKRLAAVAVEAGADIIVVQSTVTTARHISKSMKGLVISDLVQSIKAPVLVGNAVSYSSSLELMETGIAGLLVGVGPGAICTTREVIGVGVPQVTATMDCAAAREEYYRRTGRYVPIITDGGIRTGGDLCKSFASGADGVMLGSQLAGCTEAPGRGYSWGMASPHMDLPRGTRIKVGQKGPLKKILFGPSTTSDGTENYVGALKTCMGYCGAVTIRDLQRAEVIVAPAIRTEGKYLQMTQSVN
ncbi:MAG: GuaB3 family IMP dehydrogenase-related protein [Dehalococcoidia bacterium]|nr:GuaB3 family IMP dehydrogenase-related protein [Dehalococcoidia bacterium]